MKQPVVFAVLAGALSAVLFLAGCAQVSVDDASPRVADVQLSATSDMTEASQAVTVRVRFDQPLAVSGDAGADVEFLLNGAPVDADAVKLEVRPSADAISFVLTPASAQAGGSSGYFALYESRFAIVPSRSDGALAAVQGASGSNAVLDRAIEGTLPSGIVLETLESAPGSVAQNVPARAVVRVVSPPQVRAITWFSLDGGASVLLKHNHLFADADAAACAQDLARVVNESTDAKATARAQGDTLVITATAVEDGQVLDPMAVEGLGCFGGTLEPSQREAMA